MRPRFFHLLFYVRLHLSSSLFSLVGFLFSFLSLFEFLSHRLFWIRFWATIFLYYPTTPKLQKKNDEAIKITKQPFLSFRLWLVNFYFYFIFFCLGGEIFQWVSTFFFHPKIAVSHPACVFLLSPRFLTVNRIHLNNFFVIFISFLSLLFFYFIILLCFDTFLITLLAVDESAVREAVWLKGIE